MTILRNPLEAFESYYSYMNIDSKLNMDINEFAMALAVRKVRLPFHTDGHGQSLGKSIARERRWRLT